jgi:flagellar motor switch protein FliN/FliY
MQMETPLGNESPSTTLEDAVQLASLAEIPQTEATGPSLLGNNLQLIQGVKITLSARLGDAEISVGELFSLKDGSVVKLDRLTTDPVDILLDGTVIARGKLVVAADHFGISITEIPRTVAG